MSYVSIFCENNYLRTYSSVVYDKEHHRYNYLLPIVQ